MDIPAKFNTLEPGFDMSQAIAEADRCLLCYDPPCSTGCPASTDPGKFIRKLRMRNIVGAIRVIKENNILGGTCALVCPTCDLCECHCSATNLDRPIRIGKIQRFLMEYAARNNLQILEKAQPRPEKVAVIGSGPAGLSCAAELAKAGVQVTIFEKMAEPGGILRYGIPNYRLIQEVLTREIEDIRAMGVDIRCSTPIQGRNGIDELLHDGFKSVFIALGLNQPVRLNERSQSIGGVITAVEMLQSLRMTEKFQEIKQNIENRTVAIIGGGAVAIDCAESAVRLGARAVYLVYRRSFIQMPATEDERLTALRSGVHFLLLNQPLDYRTDANGTLCGLRLARTWLGQPDASGRAEPAIIPGSEWDLDCDVVVEAIGLKAADEMPGWSSDLQVNARNYIVTGATSRATSLPGVYAGGDIVRGPSLVSWAVHDGKIAAYEILATLAQEEVQ